MIETLFKQIKQNFPVRYFWGATPYPSDQLHIDKDIMIS
ncbi:MAG: hypothetical protein IPN54_07275 [Bacteroidetes bacterium]|nr:hypothetical protein [Bacteroidota bacterium]